LKFGVNVVYIYYPLGAIIYAKDMNRLAAFYAAMGFHQREVDPTCIVLQGLDAELSIIQAPGVIANSIDLGSPPQQRTMTPIKLVFIVDAIEETAVLINTHGGRVDRGKARWRFGEYFLQDAVDPEGNILQIREQVVAEK
jgi:predicted enzyme related to lactoylglutathione lyase